MEGLAISFIGVPPNSDLIEIKRHIVDSVLRRGKRSTENFFVPGRFQELLWLLLRAGERSRQDMWSIISHIKVSPKLDRRGSEDSVQCINGISSVEALLLDADPKLDVEYGKVC